MLSSDSLLSLLIDRIKANLGFGEVALSGNELVFYLTENDIKESIRRAMASSNPSIPFVSDIVNVRIQDGKVEIRLRLL